MTSHWAALRRNKLTYFAYPALDRTDVFLEKIIWNEEDLSKARLHKILTTLQTKKTFWFVKELFQQKFDSEIVMARFDVTLLFNNIPLDEAVKIIIDLHSSQPIRGNHHLKYT